MPVRAKSYKQIPMDPALRQRAEEIIAPYRNLAVTPPSKNAASDLPFRDSSEAIGAMLEELRPAAMQALAGSLEAYDRRELSIPLQRKLIRLLEGVVKRGS